MDDPALRAAPPNPVPGGWRHATSSRALRVAGALVAALALLAPVACTEAPGSGDPRPPASGSDANGATAADRTTASQDVRDPWERARRQGVEFRAIGQEPGWVFEVYPQDSLRLLADYGELEVVAPWVAPGRDEAGGTTWTASADGHTLFVLVNDVPCTDVMSGDSFPQAVIVVLDGRELHGCGRQLRE